MIAQESHSDRATETDGDDSRGRSVGSRLTDVELRVGTLKLPPMWKIKDLAVRLRLPPADGPYATAFRLLVALLAVLLVVLIVAALPVA